MPADLLAQVTRVAEELTRRFGLRGVNGADVIVTRDGDGRPGVCLLEVNPRYSASMELAQWGRGVDVLGLHLQACAGRLPEAFAAGSPSPHWGKAVVYARDAVAAPSTDDWRGRVSP